MNSCTMARKLDVSVVRTVVGGRRDALDRFLEARAGPGAAGRSGWTGWWPEEAAVVVQLGLGSGVGEWGKGLVDGGLGF